MFEKGKKKENRKGFLFFICIVISMAVVIHLILAFIKPKDVPAFPETTERASTKPTEAEKTDGPVSKPEQPPETKAEITADNFVTVISAVLTGTSDGLPVTDACLKEYKNAYFEAETVGHIEPILSMCVFEDKNAVYNITIDGRTESYGVRFALTEDKKLNYIEIYYIPGGSYDGDL